MSSTRGRVGRVGGVAVDEGAAGRTDASQQTRPAFKLSANWQSPLTKSPVGGIGSIHPLFDPTSVSFWRFFWTGAAIAYIVGFHLRLGRVKLGLGPS
jgi:hypothetical protein